MRKPSKAKAMWIALGCGMMLACCPLVATALLDGQSQRVIAVSDAATSSTAAGQIEDALRYNDMLAGGSADGIGDYAEQLDFGNGLMGSVSVPSLNIELPIYHGTSDEVLSKGAGHVEGTSLPVGGDSSNCVVSAHSGALATMFDNLRSARIGDAVILEIGGEELEYAVCEIEVIERDDISCMELTPGEDLVTLVTCTSAASALFPRGSIGVNDHRLVVTAERVETGEADCKERLTGDIRPVLTYSMATTCAGAAIAQRVRKIRKKAGKHTARLSQKEGNL